MAFAIVNMIAAVNKPSMEYMLGPSIKFKIVPKTNAPQPTILKYHLFPPLNNILPSPLFHENRVSCHIPKYY